MRVQIHWFPMSKSLYEKPRINSSIKETNIESSINQSNGNLIGGKSHRVAVWQTHAMQLKYVIVISHAKLQIYVSMFVSGWKS